MALSPEALDADDVLLLPGGADDGRAVAQDQLRGGEVAGGDQVAALLRIPK